MEGKQRIETKYFKIGSDLIWCVYYNVIIWSKLILDIFINSNNKKTTLGNLCWVLEWNSYWNGFNFFFTIFTSRYVAGWSIIVAFKGVFDSPWKTSLWLLDLLWLKQCICHDYSLRSLLRDFTLYHHITFIYTIFLSCHIA